MKKALILFTALLTLTYANAQEHEIKTELSPHHVGLHGGATTGTGFSYRYWPAKLGFQVTGIPIFTSDYHYTSIGLSALYVLKDNRKVDLFAYLGNHSIFKTQTVYSFDYVTQTSTKKKIDSFENHIGIGLGLKTSLWEVINLNFQAGYGIFNVTDSPSTFFTGEFGIYYQL